MIVKQNDRLKIMEIWLTKEDQENEVFMDGLNAKYEEWKQQGYLPVVYRSGSEPLFDCTLDLLKHNRNKQTNAIVFLPVIYQTTP